MMAQLQTTPPHDGRRSPPRERTASFNLVAVASEPPRSVGQAGGSRPATPVSFRLRESGTDSHRVRYTRIAAHTVCTSASWLRRRSGKAGVRALTAGALDLAPGGLSDLPPHLPASPRLFEPDEDAGPDHQAIVATIAALRTADALIVGPLSPDDANTPGLFPHLADLAGRAYRALRPPREIVSHPGFAQVVRRFHFIQMSHQEARALAAGAIDLGILAQRLRQLQGDHGEFAITAFGGHGVLWGDGCRLEIDPIGDETADQPHAGVVFCTAWVVARRFLGAPAPKALAYARSAAAAAVAPACKV